MDFKANDYPGLYSLADEYSAKGQSIYLKWITAELFILVLISIISLFPLGNENYGQFLAAAAAIFFALSLGVTVYIKNARLEDQWYIGRAIAESIKSLTWKYMTKGEPFIHSLSQDSADRKFIGTLKEIFESNKQFLKQTYQTDNSVDQISKQMREIRSSEFAIRKQVYIERRVEDQFNWYKSKSSYNEKKSAIFFWLIIALQGIALTYSIYLIIAPTSFSLVPFFTTFSAVLLSWLQVKRHQELSQSYAVAANEISLIRSQLDNIDGEEKLSRFVADTENAFSREHTLWLARKDVFSYSSS